MQSTKRNITHTTSWFGRAHVWRIAFVLFAALAVQAASWGQGVTLSGTITDARSGETLIGATVLDLRSGKGTVTNVNGRYSLTLKRDSVELRVSFVGYEPQFFKLYPTKNQQLNVQLSAAVELDAVVITAERVGDTRSSQMSATQISAERIKSVPVMFGEADLIKTLQLMPGVQSGSEGNSGMYVRGGGLDENLFLLDGVPLYNVTHLGGFFSAFNTDAIKNVTLYKGSFPARFGGRLSSVLDVTQNDGNDQHIHGNGSIGLISAKFNIEGPIIKNRTTFSLSARRTYAELLLIPIIMNFAEEDDNQAPDNAAVDNAKFDAGYYFYDLNAKISHKFSDRSRLYGSFYMGDDKVHGKVRTVMGTGEDMYLGFENGWGSTVGSLRWNYELTPKLFLNATASYTGYHNDIIGSVEKVELGNEPNSTIRGDYQSGIKEVTLKADLDYVPNPEHTVKFGLAGTRHWFQPEVASGSVDYSDTILFNQRLRIDSTIMNGTLPANEFTAFAEDDWSITESLKVNTGLHLSMFRVEGKYYPSVQPRLSGRWMVVDDLSIKAGYAYMTQYVHLLSTTSVTLPTDLWVPVTRRVEPMHSHQVAASANYSLSGVADFSVEAYYKWMDNLIEYKDGATFFGSSAKWEDLVYSGRGWSYGVELLVQRDFGNLTGWIGYTWSRTMRLFDREGQVLNNGKAFPAKYDRRHDISVVVTYKLNKKVDFSATWVFSTGNAATLSTQRYAIATDVPDDYYQDANGTGRGSLSYIDGRNNFRLPNYHRLDLGVNFHRQFSHCRRTINVSVYNVYNRKNPYMMYQSATDTYRGYPSALVQLSLFPILPSMAYTLYF